MACIALMLGGGRSVRRCVWDLGEGSGVLDENQSVAVSGCGFAGFDVDVRVDQVALEAVTPTLVAPA